MLKSPNEKISKDMENCCRTIKEFKDRIASQCLLKIRNPLITFQKEMCQWIFLLPYKKLSHKDKSVIKTYLFSLF